MHVLHEIFAEGYEEEYAEYAAKQRAKEYLHEVDRYVGILGLKYVQCGEGENGSGHDDTRACSDRLYDYVLSYGVFLVERSREAYGYDGNGYCRFKHLTYTQSEIGCRRAENDGKNEAHDDGVGGHLGIVVSRVHDGVVLFVGCKFAERVFGQP